MTSSDSPDILKLAEADYEHKVKQRNEIVQYYEAKRIELGLKPTERLANYLDDPGRYFRRGILYAHHGFETIIDAIDAGQEWAIVSGLNPSGPLHFGHKAMLDVLLWFQQNHGVTIHIPITNDESYVVSKVSSLRESRFNAYEYVIPSIIALGFDPKKTFIYTHSDYKHIYNVAMYLSKYVPYNTVRRIFGLDVSSNVGVIFFMGVAQMASILIPQLPEFGGLKPTLVPVGIDQHPYISLSRDVAQKLNLTPPSEIIWKFLIGLQGPGSKMAKSVKDSAIYLTDTPGDVKRKIKKAYSGGSPLASMQRERGGIPEVCPAFDLLTFNLENENEYQELLSGYRDGSILTGEIKDRATKLVTQITTEHIEKREEAKKRVHEFIMDKPIMSVLEQDMLVEAMIGK